MVLAVHGGQESLYSVTGGARRHPVVEPRNGAEEMTTGMELGLASVSKDQLPRMVATKWSWAPNLLVQTLIILQRVLLRIRIKRWLQNEAKDFKVDEIGRLHVKFGGIERHYVQKGPNNGILSQFKSSG